MTGLATNITTKSADEKKLTGACNTGRKVKGRWVCLPLRLAHRLYCDSVRVATYRKSKPTVETSSHTVSTFLLTEAPDVNN